MKFIDFFSGVGGFRRGMELAGHECVGFCEFDKFAVAGYTAMHLMTEQEREYISTLPKNKRVAEAEKEEYRHGEWYANDIRRIFAEDIPKADCWCFGFPCQDISVAGKQLGFDGARSSLFFRVIRLVQDLEEKDRPTYLFIENVKNLALMGERTSLNFSLHWTKAGTMQNGKLSTLPITSHKTEKEYSLLDILEGEVPQKYFLSKEQTEKIVFK